MKYEPLKLKDLKQNVREIFADKEKFAYIQNSAQRKMDHEYGFLHAISIVEGRVKSAVQGLLQELDNEIDVHRPPSPNDWLEGVVDGLEIAKELIKKWFADVVEGEE